MNRTELKALIDDLIRPNNNSRYVTGKRANDVFSALNDNLVNIEDEFELNDKFLILNKEGGIASGDGAGFGINENSILKGYIKTTSNRAGWIFKAPANNFDTTFAFAPTANRTLTVPDKTGTLATLTDFTGAISPYLFADATPNRIIVSDSSGKLSTNDNLTYNGTLLQINTATGSTPTIYLSDDDVAHGVTDIVPTNVFGRIEGNNPIDGGINILGLSEAVPAMVLSGIIGSGSATIPAVLIDGSKKSGTNIQALSNTDLLFTVRNSGSHKLAILGSGFTGIGTISPSGIVHVDAGAATGNVIFDRDAGNPFILSYRTDNISRWEFRVDTAESGGNVGSDLAIRRYNDAGALLSTPLFIKRNNGYIGINTVTPGGLVDIVGNSSLTSPDADAALFLHNTDTTAGNTFTIAFSTNDLSATRVQPAWISAIFTDHTAGAVKGALAFYTANNAGVPSERMRIIASGDVGIGTSTPLSKLQVLDTSVSSVRGIILAQYSTGSDGSQYLLRKARGTEGAPTVITVNDVLGQVIAEGYDGANYLQMGAIKFVSEVAIAATSIPTHISFWTATSATPSILTERIRIDSSGRTGFGIASPTAIIHLKAGTATANTAPLKFDSGALLTTPEVGAVEFLTDKWYGTITTGAVRKEFVLADATLTSGRIALISTNGRLSDTGLFTFDPDNLNLLIGTATIGTSSINVIAIKSGTAPTTNITDVFHFYGKDQAAGNACPTFKTELGHEIILFRGAVLTAANAGVADLIYEATEMNLINNHTTRINEIEARLQAFGLLA